MLAKSVPDIPEGPFSFEPKWDGFRAVVFRDGDEVEIGSRNERPMTRYFPELVAAIKAELPERCVIDGEIVIPDREGRRLDFEALLQRIHPAETRINLLAEQTPASAGRVRRAGRGRREPDRSSRSRPGGSALEEALAGAGPSVHLTPATTDRADGAGLVRPVRGGGAGRRGGQAAGRPVRRGQADHVQDQARAHGGLRGGRLPPAQERPGRGGLAAARPVQRRGRAGQRGRDRRVPDGAAPRADDGAAALGDQLRRAPVELAAARGRPAHPAQGRGQPVELGQGPVVRAAAARSGWWRSRYDHMEGVRFRHTAQFVRWRPDRTPQSCTYAQLEEPVNFDLGQILA